MENLESQERVLSPTLAHENRRKKWGKETNEDVDEIRHNIKNNEASTEF